MKAPDQEELLGDNMHTSIFARRSLICQMRTLLPNVLFAKPRMSAFALRVTPLPKLRSRRQEPGARVLKPPYPSESSYIANGTSCGSKWDGVLELGVLPNFLLVAAIVCYSVLPIFTLSVSWSVSVSVSRSCFASGAPMVHGDHRCRTTPLRLGPSLRSSLVFLDPPPPCCPPPCWYAPLWSSESCTSSCPSSLDCRRALIFSFL